VEPLTGLFIDNALYRCQLIRELHKWSCCLTAKVSSKSLSVWDWIGLTHDTVKVTYHADRRFNHGAEPYPRNLLKRSSARAEAVTPPTNRATTFGSSGSPLVCSPPYSVNIQIDISGMSVPCAPS
jgi:hypothetical protein